MITFTKCTLLFLFVTINVFAGEYPFKFPNIAKSEDNVDAVISEAPTDLSSLPEYQAKEFLVIMHNIGNIFFRSTGGLPLSLNKPFDKQDALFKSEFQELIEHLVDTMIERSTRIKDEETGKKKTLAVDTIDACNFALHRYEVAHMFYVTNYKIDKDSISMPDAVIGVSPFSVTV